MQNEQNQVNELLIKWKFAIPPHPQFPEVKMQYRCMNDLIRITEVIESTLNSKDIVELAKAVGYLLYSTVAFASTFGIKLEDIWNEIHKSNMSNLNNKFVPPDIKEVLAKQYKDSIL